MHSEPSHYFGSLSNDWANSVSKQSTLLEAEPESRAAAGPNREISLVDCLDESLRFAPIKQSMVA